MPMKLSSGNTIYVTLKEGDDKPGQKLEIYCKSSTYPYVPLFFISDSKCDLPKIRILTKQNYIFPSCSTHKSTNICLACLHINRNRKRFGGRTKKKLWKDKNQIDSALDWTNMQEWVYIKVLDTSQIQQAQVHPKSYLPTYSYSNITMGFKNTFILRTWC